MRTNLIKIFCLAVFLTGFILILGNIRRIIPGITPDFSVLWLSAKDLSLGINPYPDPRAYTPNGYPPASLIFYIPLAFLPYQSAQAVFTLISFAALVAMVFLALKLATGRVIWYWFLLALGMTLFSFPVKFSLGMGQINMVVLCLLLLSVFLESKKKPLPAGVILGVSIALKPIFAFFLLFFVLRRSWKIVKTCLFTILFIVFSTFLFWPPDIWISWLKIGIFPLSNLAGREVYYNQGLAGFISRFFVSIDVRKYLTGFISLCLVLISSIFAAKKKDSKLVFSFFILVLLMVDTLSWQHHFVWISFPFILLTTHALKTKKTLFLALIGFAYLLTAWNFKNPSAFPPVLISNQFYGTLILLGINYKILSEKDNQSRKRY